MHVIDNCTDRDELRRRLAEIKRTLAYLASERRDLERNAAWMDANAYRRRMDLFDCLSALYDAECQEINETIGTSGV
jgi:hypothetical protein